jgi:hypothetical protein
MDDAAVADPWDQMDVEGGGVVGLRVARQVRRDVALPPQLGELLEGLRAGADRRGGAEPFGPLEVGVERLGVAFAADDTRVRCAVLIAPAESEAEADGSRSDSWRTGPS